jgi:hypothetical protein
VIALALSVGRLDYEAVMDELTPHQFSVLMEHRQQHPTREQREDLRHAHLVACVMNLVRGEGAEPIETRDALAHFLHEIKSKKRDKGIGPAQAARLGTGRR